jgi:hypothetical protein
MRRASLLIGSSAVLADLLLGTACGSKATDETDPAKPAAIETALVVAPEERFSAEERAARDVAALPVEELSAEQQRAHSRARAMALRTALATQRRVLAELQARRGASREPNPGLDAEIAARQQRIAERGEQLRVAEDLSR